MAKEKSTNESATESAEIRQLPKAKPMSMFAEKWLGMSPHDIDPNVSNSECDKVELSDLDGETVTVYGMLKKSGTTGPWAVIACIVSGHDIPVVFVTGAAVILRKLDTAYENGGFPVAGQIVKRKGKKFTYFDIV